jgi:protein-L-isoaspartate(D-aspartate) O-methyltransferase
MNFDSARVQMVEQQVRAWDVLDEKVLDTLTQVPREHFVPEAYRELAFADTAIDLGHGETMMTPQQEGRLLQALEPRKTDNVLEIGTGSGFLTACLARLAGRVRSMEIHEHFCIRAREKLAALEFDNVNIDCADAMNLAQRNRYDAVAVTGSVPHLERRFQDALKIGGRLFVIVGKAPVMEALLITRVTEDEWLRQTLFETVVPPLKNVPEITHFEF